MFSCEFCEIIKSIFLQSTSGRLLLIAIITQRSQKRYVMWDKVFEDGPSQIFGGQLLWFILVLSQNQKQPPEVFCKKAFLEISQNSQEISCVSLFFNPLLENFIFCVVLLYLACQCPSLLHNIRSSLDGLTLSWRKSLSYKNHIDLQSK